METVNYANIRGPSEKTKLKPGLYICRCNDTIEAVRVDPGRLVEWDKYEGFTGLGYYYINAAYDWFTALGMMKPLEKGELRKVKRHAI